MKVKICGITHPKDAEEAAYARADYIGIVFASQSKRCVTPSQAREISHAARQGGTEPIGIFAEETLDEILTFSEQAEITIVQLHGNTSRKLLKSLMSYFQSIIYAVKVEVDGSVPQIPRLPSDVYPLFDCLNGGTGKTFDWESFNAPKKTSWILAGGLNPYNVATAIHKFNPWGVDVSSGVELPHSTRKDPYLVKAFINAAKKEIL